MTKYLLPIFLVGCILFTSSCALFRQPLDRMTGFSKNLRQVEKGIRKEDWAGAAAGLKKATKAWRQMKPFLQVDIDHDYVNEIEADFIRLKGNIETREKSHSLGYILLIQDNWENIGSM